MTAKQTKETEPRVNYRVGYLSGSFVVEYEQAGRTWFEKDADGRTLWFDHRSEAQAWLEKRGLDDG